MYKVLYRKWRPQVFADVVGQPQVTVTLKNELMAGRIAHAYLFTGSRGTGKTTCAKILAKAINCLNPVNGDPCGECEICRGVDSGSVMDIVEIDAASNNGVENIRSLREEANFTPAAAKYRVYIIDEVHMLSVGAFNALLKTLEEPPDHVVFILATTEVHKLPATILSRCQRLDFRRIPPEDIAARLTYVTEQEGGTLEEQAGLLIARLADGALRDALSLLDQCLGRSKEITADVVRATAGLAGREHLLHLAECIQMQNTSGALEIVQELHQASKDMARLCEELSGHFRALMLIKTMKDASKILAVPEDELEQLTKQALVVELPVILHTLDVLQQTMEAMFRGGDRRMEFEMALIRLCTPELESSNEALLRRIEVLERSLRTASSAPAAAPRQGAPAVAPSRLVPASVPEKPPLPSQEPPLPALQEVPAAPQEASVQNEPMNHNAVPLAEWPEILKLLKESSSSISAAFAGSSAYVSGDYVLIDAAREMAFKLLRQSAHRDSMREAIRQITGRVYKLGPYKSAETEKSKKDPLLELADLAQQAGIDVQQI